MEPLVFGKQYGPVVEEQLERVIGDPSQTDTLAMIKLHLTQVGPVFHVVEIYGDSVEVTVFPRQLMDLRARDGVVGLDYTTCTRAHVYKEDGQWIARVEDYHTPIIQRHVHPSLKSALRRARRFIARYAEKPQNAWHQVTAEHFGVIETLTPPPVRRISSNFFNPWECDPLYDEWDLDDEDWNSDEEDWYSEEEEDTI